MRETCDRKHSFALPPRVFPQEAAKPHWRRCTNVHIIGVVVEWDADKAAVNLQKHRVDFADAATVLEDEAALTVPDEDPDEERWVTLGMDALGRILVVVYAWQEEEVRLVSARKANPSERSQYESKR
jgi:uncharacterized DUF497 family protein